jgi:hypothetical protein
MSDLRFLNPDDFRRWMKKNDVEEDVVDQPIGMRVESKFCGKKIARSMTLESGRAGRVVREFVQNGGTVKSVDGDEYLVEVKSGSFYTNKKNLIF